MGIAMNIVWFATTIIIAVFVARAGVYAGALIQMGMTHCEYQCFIGAIVGAFVGFIFVIGSSIRLRAKFLSRGSEDVIQ